MGDAVMAVFGVPLLHEDDALRALRAAAELREEIARLNEDLEARLRRADRSAHRRQQRRGDRRRHAARPLVRRRGRGQRRAASRGRRRHGGDPDRRATTASRATRSAPRRWGCSSSGTGVSRSGAPIARGASRRALAYTPLRLADGRAPPRAPGGRGRLRACGRRALVPPVHGPGRGRRGQVQARPRRRSPASATVPACSSAPAFPTGRASRSGRPSRSSSRARASSTATRRRTRCERSRPRSATTRQRRSLPNASPRSSGSRSRARRPSRASGPFASSPRRWRASSRRSIVFDDVNSGEPRFLELVEHLADSVHDAPLLIVCMARPDLLDARPSVGRRKRNATSIFLEPLSTDESGELLSNLLASGYPTKSPRGCRRRPRGIRSSSRRWSRC